MNENIEKSKRLEFYLQKEIKQHQFSARIKNITAQLLFLLVIIVSGLGLLNSATNWFEKKGLTVLAVIPGIIVLITNTFKFEARAKWNKLKQRKLEGLYRKLQFENASVEDVSKEMTIELEKLDAIRVQLEKPIN
jgi:hypothetical protein